MAELDDETDLLADAVDADMAEHENASVPPAPFEEESSTDAKAPALQRRKLRRGVAFVAAKAGCAATGVRLAAHIALGLICSLCGATPEDSSRIFFLPMFALHDYGL